MTHGYTSIAAGLVVIAGVLWLVIRHRHERIAALQADYSAEEVDHALEVLAGRGPHTVKVGPLPTLVIRYREPYGGEADFKIDVTEAVLNAEAREPAITHLNAFCHADHTLRTFQMDRIKSIVNAQTGEAVTASDIRFSSSVR